MIARSNRPFLDRELIGTWGTHRESENPWPAMRIKALMAHCELKSVGMAGRLGLGYSTVRNWIALDKRPCDEAAERLDRLAVEVGFR
jgi:DNA-binding transcriptional regulator YiaG